VHNAGTVLGVNDGVTFFEFHGSDLSTD